MKKVFITFLLSLFLLPCMATRIDVKANAMSHHGGGARVPTLTRVEADLDDDAVTVNIHSYTGIVIVYLYDNSGNVVETATDYITGNGTVTTSVSSLTHGGYSLSIVLDDVTYEGAFHLEPK